MRVEPCRGVRNLNPIGTCRCASSDAGDTAESPPGSVGGVRTGSDLEHGVHGPHAEVRDEGHPGILGDPGRLLGNDPELQPEYVGADGCRLLRDLGSLVSRSKNTSTTSTGSGMSMSVG